MKLPTASGDHPLILKGELTGKPPRHSTTSPSWTRLRQFAEGHPKSVVTCIRVHGEDMGAVVA